MQVGEGAQKCVMGWKLHRGEACVRKGVRRWLTQPPSLLTFPLMCRKLSGKVGNKNCVTTIDCVGTEAEATHLPISFLRK